MNPHAAHSASPAALIRSIWHHRRLIRQMTWREVIGRYKGSILGLGWSFFNPLMLLTVYTFVFSVVFKARWGISTTESRTDFALILFVGLIIHTLFAEVLNRAPGLILGNANYVKKVVFPLEILTVISLGSALFHALISFLVLLVAFTLLNGFVNWTIIYAPITLLPILPLTLGLGWLLASLGVYLRDIGQVIAIITIILLFIAPVFYPITMLPQAYQSILLLNPLTLPIEQTRAVLVFGQSPNWMGLAIYTCISATICWIGFWWFQKTRKGFADVL
uniref:Transport permease protein n=1 Tax=Candidatus Kentrum sp. SD TaxID=2126332 RepID=A0A451BM15_9GAMM|nr:MAG: lipopolysaccharide transport system permease protein [Candidatus Kentron sp. SD]